MLEGTIALLCQELVMVYDVNPCDNSALYGCKYHRNNTGEGDKNSRYLQASQQEDHAGLVLHTQTLMHRVEGIACCRETAPLSSLEGGRWREVWRERQAGTHTESSKPLLYWNGVERIQTSARIYGSYLVMSSEFCPYPLCSRKSWADRIFFSLATGDPH